MSPANKTFAGSPPTVAATAALTGKAPENTRSVMNLEESSVAPIPIIYKSSVSPGYTGRATRPSVTPLPTKVAVPASAAVTKNVLASALGGAAGMLADSAPEHADRAASVVREMLARPPLMGTAELLRPSPAHARWFLVRNNCCLYYRIPGGGTCADCVLTADADRRRSWRAVLERS